MRALLAIVVLLGALGVAGWVLSAPDPLAAADLPSHTADVSNGERIFNLAGCASCHAAPGDADDNPLLLSGGQRLATPLGVIVVPNISPNREHGIGGWSDRDFVNAVTRGVAPDGSHYVPAFPWTAYRHMRLTDVLDLRGYLATLPRSASAPAADGLPFPYSWRRPIGLWKTFAMTEPPAAPPSDDPRVERGHYLVTALGHCGECHTPRTVTLASDPSRWLRGAPDPEGRSGRVPSIAPDGIGDWSAADVAYLLESGFDPDYDSVGGLMAPVVDNWSQVPAADREAVAAYLKAVPASP